MKKYKLVFFGVKYYPSKGGVSRIAENLIRNLKDKYDITIYCYRNEKAKEYIQGINVIQLPEIPLGGLGVFIYFLLCCVHMLVKGKYDIVHLKKIDTAFFIPILRLKFRKILATSHESPYLRDKWNKIARSYFKLNERIFIKSSSYITAISKPLSDIYEKKYNRKVTYIPNGIDLNYKYDFETANKIIKEHNITPDYVFFGARRIMASKGCHTMLKALEIINYKNSVVISGDTTQVANYTKELKNNYQSVDKKFIGYLDDKNVLLALIKNAEFFIFPSETEGMSVMLLEVASTGTPIICSDISENSAVFNASEVLFFKNMNAENLAVKIKWALDNKQIMKKKSEMAKKKVVKYYSGEVMTKNYEKLYDSILASSI